MRKRVLVYPCGTEIGLEIYRSLCFSIHYELIGGTDGYNHGDFVYHNLIRNLPFITDDSTEVDILCFEEEISNYHIDFIYPAMDGVIAVFAKYKNLFKETVIVPDAKTAGICRSKKLTYSLLEGVLDIPVLFDSVSSVTKYPVFVKPDVGQGSVGSKKINTAEELADINFDDFVVMEYLSGREYTVDCFTNGEGKLIYANGRSRNRIKNGISVNTAFDKRNIFWNLAIRINDNLKQKGGWFFQLRESDSGTLKLLEVAARIAGTSAISRNIGANLPLMTLDIFNNIRIDDVTLNEQYVELDRALDNRFKTDITFSTVYIDYDDTIVHDKVINLSVIKFIFQCINQQKKIILLSKHRGELKEELQKFRIKDLFDKVIHIDSNCEKADYIEDKDSIFIDDSYGERRNIKLRHDIPVFDTHMLECLLED